MTSIPIFQVDAFTELPFAGNPAAVCLLPEARPEPWMQAVAHEMNLSETAFLVPRNRGFELRWFTPEVEVELCGHATLASSHVLWNEAGASADSTLDFFTASGALHASRAGELIELDFPTRALEVVEAPAGLAEALGAEPVLVARSRDDLLVLVDNESTVRSLEPDISALHELPTRGTIVTARSSQPEHDFVSRFFAPAVGIAEDPVTGSAHCALAPFWADRLGKTEMRGFQASARGGEVAVRMKGDRVVLGGKAVTVMRGELMA